MPLPNEEETPPVTKMYFAMILVNLFIIKKYWIGKQQAIPKLLFCINKSLYKKFRKPAHPN